MLDSSKQADLFTRQVFPDHELAMVVVGTIKGNGSGVIKPVTRFKPAHNFIICGARSLFTKDVNTILPGYFVVFGSQQAMRCENFIPSFFYFALHFFSFSNNSLPYYLNLIRSCQILEMSLTTKECALAAILLVLDQVTVRNEFGPLLHLEATCYQMLILI